MKDTQFVVRHSILRVEQLEVREVPAAFGLETGTLATDRVLLALSDPITATALSRLPFSRGIESLGLGIYSIDLAPGTSMTSAVASLRRTAGVAGAEPDYRVSVARTPNDPQYGQLYGLEKISAPGAWNTQTGTGQTVVSVVDTGIDYTHPDLYQNIWLNQNEIPVAVRNRLVDVDGDALITFRDLNNAVNRGTDKVTDLNGNGYIDGGDLLKPTTQGGWADGSDQGGNGYTDDLIGWDFANNDNDPYDDDGHGTHVSGTIGAVGNNGTGLAGVAWTARIMAVKFLNGTGSGYVSDAVRALDYSIQNGARISNNSWGGGGLSQALTAAIGRARTAGHIVVAAAGNAGQNGDFAPSYPAYYASQSDNVVSVSAVDQSDNPAYFSNYGTASVTLGAPGVNIFSTLPGGQYGNLSGTSMAAPHVAGALALLWDQSPNLSYQDAITKLKQSVDVRPQLAGKTATGGRLNLNKLIESTEAPPSPPVTPPADTTGARITAATYSGLATNSFDRVRVTFSESIVPGTFTAADVFISGPNGENLPVTSIRVVAGTNGTQFDILLASQTAPGAYSVTVGPDVRDLAGNRMDQNRNGVNGESNDKATISFTLPDRTGARIAAASYSGLTANSFNRLRVTFSEAIDPTTFTASDVVVTGPNGQRLAVSAVVPVPGSNGTQFDIVLSANQTAGGKYSVTVGPDVRDLAGNRMDQNRNGVNGESNDKATISFTLPT